MEKTVNATVGVALIYISLSNLLQFVASISDNTIIPILFFLICFLLGILVLMGKVKIIRADGKTSQFIWRSRR
ncbi:MAG: hypothetical protein DRN78_02925 [Thermoproteota archaeon]|nr:MAG: hypothetical protein DRN78_02925 [Candidatus Korarchaeota archaeon]